MIQFPISKLEMLPRPFWFRIRLQKYYPPVRKYFSSINKDENYTLSLDNLASAKKVIFDFFDNVKVNDEEQNIKKNRLELLQMLCRTFDNYVIFSNIEIK